MEIRLARGRLRIHVLLFPVCMLMLYLHGVVRFFSFAGALLLHELFHLFMASAMGVEVLSLELLPFGCAANMGGMELVAKGREALIAVAGPGASLLIAAGCRALFPGENPWAEAFLQANLALGGMNLLPVYPLDGGRIAAVLLEMFLKRRTARKIAAILGMLVGAGVCLIGAMQPGVGSISCWVMGGFMVISAGKSMCAKELDALAMPTIKCGGHLGKTSMEVKNIACGSEKTLGEILLMLDRRKYNIVYVLDEEMRIREVLDEGVLMQRMLREGSAAPVLRNFRKKESEQKLLRLSQ